MRAHRAAFREWFGLTATEATVLAFLAERAAKFSTADQIAEALGLAPGAIKTHVCTLRQALEAEAIDSVPRQGYRLTEDGLSECREAVNQMIREAMA